MPRCHREAQRRLFEIAEAQQGFFTTKQAKAAGFAENTHSYHVKVGNWIREYRGIYRLESGSKLHALQTLRAVPLPLCRVNLCSSVSIWKAPSKLGWF